jgi:DNA-directed RNA polymerase subunit N (RpoN/RPB10)
VDEAAAAAWAANELRRKKLLEERLSEEAKVTAKLEAREKWVQALIDEEDLRRAEGEGVAAARFDSAARLMAKSKVAASAISMKTTRIVGDYRIGHNTPTGLPTPISERDARQIAIGEWVDEQVAGEMKSVAEEWAVRRRNLDTFILEQRSAWEKIDAINADRQKRIDAKRHAELSILRGQRTVELRKRLTLPDFDKIQLSKPHNCEHVRCRAWGDCYGKGVRCVDCGQEMSKTHESFKQLAGVGSGDNSTLVEQVGCYMCACFRNVYAVISLVFGGKGDYLNLLFGFLFEPPNCVSNLTYALSPRWTATAATKRLTVSALRRSWQRWRPSGCGWRKIDETWSWWIRCFTISPTLST